MDSIYTQDTQNDQNMNERANPAIFYERANKLPASTEKMLSLGVKFMPRFENMKTYTRMLSKDIMIMEKRANNWIDQYKRHVCYDVAEEMKTHLMKKFRFATRTPSSTLSYEQIRKEFNKDEVKEALKHASIVACDKNMGVCVIDNTYLDQLTSSFIDNHKENFKQAEYDVITQLKCNIRTVEIAVNKLHVDYKTKAALKPDAHASVPPMAVLIKEHKSPISIRPVIAAACTPSTRMAIAIIHAINVLLAKLEKKFGFRVVTENSWELLLEINKLTITTVDHDKTTLFVTMDFADLYTNIKWSDVKEAFDFAFDALKAEAAPLLKQDLLTVCRAIYDTNTFTKGNKCYTQQDSLVMGMNAAVALANFILFTHEIKCKQAWKEMQADSAVYLYRRLVDDIIIVIHASTDTSLKILKHVQTKAYPQHMKLNAVVDQNSVAFLDLLLSIKHGGLNDTIVHKIYSKPMDSHTFLNYSSAHPSHVKASIVHAGCVRRMVLSSSRRDYTDAITDFSAYLRKADYPNAFIAQHLNKSFTRRARAIYMAKYEAKLTNRRSALLDEVLNVQLIGGKSPAPQTDKKENVFMFMPLLYIPDTGTRKELNQIWRSKMDEWNTQSRVIIAWKRGQQAFKLMQNLNRRIQSKL